ncbi:MAG: protein kinase [Deltaproteobacteria bacterium]|nr:protein kinase [Deltaproteobacteria bacterium]
MHSLSARPQLRDHVELHMSPEGTTGELVVLAGGRVSSPTVGYDDPPPQARPSLPELPRKIGRYAVLDVIGIGGMGVVCTAYDPKLDRKVALKLLRQREFEDPKRTATARARLHREARALAKLKHGNVVAVHDVDVFEGRLYIAMEYVEGQSLSEWLDERPRSWREIVVKFVQAARARGRPRRWHHPPRLQARERPRGVGRARGRARLRPRARTRRSPQRRAFAR